MLKILGRIIGRGEVAGLFSPFGNGISGIFEVYECLGELCIRRIGEPATDPAKFTALDLHELMSERPFCAMTKAELKGLGYLRDDDTLPQKETRRAAVSGADVPSKSKVMNSPKISELVMERHGVFGFGGLTQVPCPAHPPDVSMVEVKGFLQACDWCSGSGKIYQRELEYWQAFQSLDDQAKSAI